MDSVRKILDTPLYTVSYVYGLPPYQISIVLLHLPATTIKI